MTGLEFILDLSIVALIAGVVGLICRRLGISVVVGYLVAGIIIGPYSPPFLLLQDQNRVSMLADLGLLFLIFGIGLGFNIRRIQRLGVSLLFITGLGALLVLGASRTVSAFLGLTDQQSLFVAGVLMVSSSAIIAKVLEEMRQNHSRWGQQALGVTLLEDIVAVVMLTLLSSLTTFQGQEASIWITLAHFMGFVVLFSLGVLALIPPMFRWLERSATPELRMLVVAGMLLALGWLAVKLGYSMALTAFILGAVMGSTPQRIEVDRLFEGLRHLFGAVFFVAMGMMFNIGLFPQFWPLLLALTGAAFLLRIPALMVGFLAAGNPLKESTRASLTLTPLGEFSFVIAFLGVQSGIMPDTFYPAAVGASLVTCLISPLLIRSSGSISSFVEAKAPARFTRRLESYDKWLARVGAARERSLVWSLVAPRLLRVMLQLLIVSGCLALSHPAYRFVLEAIGPDMLIEGGTTILFLVAVGLVVLAPLIAAWTNIVPISMIIAEASLIGGKPNRRRQVLLERIITWSMTTLALIWIWVLAPTELVPPAVFLGVFVVLGLAGLLLWRQLSRWHERLEYGIHREFLQASQPSSVEHNRKWNIPVCEETNQFARVEEMTMPPNSKHAGKSIMDTQLRRLYQASIVAIDRQGYAINNPSPHERLFPSDRLLLLGSEDAIKSATSYLSQQEDKPGWTLQFDEMASEMIVMPPGTEFENIPLKNLALVQKHAVQIGGIIRGEKQIASPAGDTVLLPGDSVLVIGALADIRDFKERLASSSEPIQHENHHSSEPQQ